MKMIMRNGTVTNRCNAWSQSSPTHHWSQSWTWWICWSEPSSNLSWSLNWSLSWGYSRLEE
jgi:hypothetical protein